MKNFYHYFPGIVLLFLSCLSSCSTGREMVMPFKNTVYSGERLFPVQTNDAQKIVRVWINNGTSIERVITVSRDSLFGDQCELHEFGFLTTKNIFRQVKTNYYHIKKQPPKSGYVDFFRKIDSLQLFQFKNQTDFKFILNHEPYSLYVVEIKENGIYHQFSFRTYFPAEHSVAIEYEAVQKLIFSEIPYNFYME